MALRAEIMDKKSLSINLVLVFAFISQYGLVCFFVILRFSPLDILARNDRDCLMLFVTELLVSKFIVLLAIGFIFHFQNLDQVFVNSHIILFCNLVSCMYTCSLDWEHGAPVSNSEFEFPYLVLISLPFEVSLYYPFALFIYCFHFTRFCVSQVFCIVFFFLI